MAVKPIPDQSKEFIKSGMVLITDPRSDKYLNKHQSKENQRSSKWHHTDSDLKNMFLGV